VPLKIIPVPPSLSLSLLSRYHELSKFSLPFFSTIMFSFPTAQRTDQLWTETSEIMCHNRSFLFLICFSQIFVNEKLTNTVWGTVIGLVPNIAKLHWGSDWTMTVLTSSMCHSIDGFIMWMFWRWQKVGGETWGMSASWGPCSWVDIMPLAPSSSWLPSSYKLCVTTHSAVMFCLTIGPEIKYSQVSMDWNFWNLSQNNLFFSLKFIFSGI
jgi:hypothetical protein